MDADRFETMIRALGAGGARRRVLRLLATLPLAGSFAARRDPESAAARRKIRHRRVKRRRDRVQEQRGKQQGKRRQAGAEACIPTGKVCPSKKPHGKKGKTLGCGRCCQRHVETTPDGTSRCACKPGGLSCREQRECCSGICSGGVCQAGASPPPTPGCTVSSQCGTGSLCLEGACQACDVCASGCQFSMVQAAIDADPPLATIRVCAGTYAGGIVIDRDLTLIGAGDGDDPANDTVLDAAGASRTVRVNPGAATVSLSRLRLTGAVGGNNSGGGVFHAGQTLTMTGCTVTGNSAFSGGGVFNGVTCPLFLTDCTIMGNTVQNRGGGILFDGPATLTNCRVVDNFAPDFGGGLSNHAAVITLDGTVVTNNTCNGGGGIFNDGGTVILSNGSVVVGNIPNNCRGDPIDGCSG